MESWEDYSAEINELRQRVKLLEQEKEKAEKVEQKLQQSQKELWALLENTDDFILFSDKEGFPRFFNSAYAKIMKKTLNLDMKPGIKPHTLLPDKASRHFWEGLHQRVLGGEKFVIEYPHQDEDKLYYYEVSFNPIWENNDVVGFSEYTRDITQRKEAEKILQQAHDELEQKVDERTRELREEKERTQRYLDIAGTVIIALNTNGEVTLINQKGCEILGYRQEEVLGKNWFANFIADSDYEKTSLYFRHLTQEQKALGEFFENDILASDGSIKKIFWHNTLLYDEMRKVTGTLSSGEDVTERRRLEKELHKSQRLENLEMLAGGIAHDFNNILTAILGNIELSQDPSVAAVDLEELLDEAKTATLQARKLTEQLLAFAKGKKPTKQALNICSLTKNTVKFALRGSKISCHFNCLDDASIVEVDEGQISQVFYNLVINAIQAMPDGGELFISQEKITLQEQHPLLLLPGEYVKICFRDTGPGIAPEHISQIFDPYFTTKSTGRGLGLAASYNIAKRHEGMLTVDSQWKIGSTFCVYLPVAHPKPDKKNHKSHRRLKVLVMDDEIMVRELLDKMLAMLKCDIVLTKDGNETVKAYREALNKRESFDLVILDITIPGGKGGDIIAEELIAIDPGAKLIATSGSGNNDYLNQGFCCYLPKPFLLDDVKKVLDQVRKMEC